MIVHITDEQASFLLKVLMQYGDDLRDIMREIGPWDGWEEHMQVLLGVVEQIAAERV